MTATAGVSVMTAPGAASPERGSGEALWRRIGVRLGEEIGRRYPPGARLPTEGELARRRFGIG